MSAKGRNILAIALFLSLLANGLLGFLLLRSKGTDDKPGPDNPAAYENPSAPGDSSGSKSAQQDPSDKLSALPMKVFLSGMGDSRSKADNREGESEEETKQRILCSIARRTTSDEWRINRDKARRDAARSLSEPEQRERNIRERADKFKAALNLSDSDFEAFDRKYRTLRAKTDPRIAEELNKSAPDYALSFDLVEDLLDSEQDLVDDMFGDEAAEKAADHLREDRLTILAILASWAGMDWDEAIAP